MKWDHARVCYLALLLNGLGLRATAGLPGTAASPVNHAHAIDLYRRLAPSIRGSEQIQTVLEGKQTFHVFVPFVPHGEYMGAVYMKNTPDFSFISREIISSYDEIALTFSGLILFGLLAMFYIFSFTMKERNEAQQLLFRKE